MQGLQMVEIEIEEEPGFDYEVVRPDGSVMLADCYDKALRWAGTLADCEGVAVLVRFRGKREEYPTYDFTQVTFLCEPGGGIRHREVDGKYEDWREYNA